MGKKSGPSAPPAPDPTVVSAAQAEANIKTAQEQQRLNMVNATGPYGQVTYTADPTAPGGYRQTTTLSQGEQAVYDLGNSANVGALQLANQQVGRIGQALATPLSTDGLPGLSGGSDLGAGQGIRSTFDTGPALQYGFNQGQQIQGQVGGDLNAARQQAIDATYSQATSRLDPRFDRAQSQLDTRLANQGLSMNSAAAQNAQEQFGRDRNDAYNQAQFSAIQAGEDAAQGQFGRQLSQGQFANQAAGQQYGQGLGTAQFFNQTAGQQYGQNMGEGQFANAAQNQGFNQKLAAAQLENQARQQGLQERAYVQNQPISQYAALTSGQPVQMPQGIQYTPSAVANTDVMGAYALQSQAQQAQYQAQMQKQAGMMGGLFSLGSAALMASDERLKRDVVKVGERPDGLGVYAFNYIWGGPRRLGVMAQEVLKVLPHAVFKDRDGFMSVNYGAL